MDFSTTYNKDEKIWSSSQASHYDPKLTVGQILLNELKANETNIAQINHDTDYKMTYKEMRLRALKIAENLTKVHGIKCGDHVTILLSQDDNLVPLLIGLFAIGAIVNPLDVSFTVPEIVHFLKITNPKLIICDVSVVNFVRQSLIETKQVANIIISLADDDGSSNGQNEQKVIEGNVTVNDLLDGYEVENLNFELPTINDAAKELVLVLCSSGTTGPQKGVCVTHYMLLKGTDENWIERFEQNIYFNSSLPLWLTFHVCYVQSILNGGSRVFTNQQPVTATLLLELIEKHKIHILFTIPYTTLDMIRLLNANVEKYDLSSYKYHMTGGTVILDQMVKGMTRHMRSDARVVSIYGLSEIGGTAASTLHEYRENSAGKLRGGLQAKIIDYDGGDRCLGPNEIGEILLRQKFPFSGYFNDDEQTRKTFLSDGWLKTGDIGYFDNDGFLFLLDRKMEKFKYNGIAISATELVQFIRKRFVDRVEVVCVVGVPAEDGQNFLPTAIIKKRKDDDISESEIAKFVEENLSDAKKLRGGVYFVDSLPLTRNGKIKIRDVQQIAINLYKESIQKFQII